MRRSIWDAELGYRWKIDWERVWKMNLETDYDSEFKGFWVKFWKYFWKAKFGVCLTHEYTHVENMQFAQSKVGVLLECVSYTRRYGLFQLARSHLFLTRRTREKNNPPQHLALLVPRHVCAKKHFAALFWSQIVRLTRLWSEVTSRSVLRKTLPRRRQQQKKAGVVRGFRSCSGLVARCACVQSPAVLIVRKIDHTRVHFQQSMGKF